MDFSAGRRSAARPLAKHSLDKPLSPLASPLPAKAKRCIFLFMYGGPSQMDLFDYKPELQKRHGQTRQRRSATRLDPEADADGLEAQIRQRHGESGQWCSDALPCIARQMDKLAVVKSLQMDSFAHASALIQMNSGRVLQGHPCLGSWVNYGLGSLNENLPGFVVMLDPRGGPIAGAANWMSGYMPAAYQGTVLRSTGRPILNLSPLDRSRPEMAAGSSRNDQRPQCPASGIPPRLFGAAGANLRLRTGVSIAVDGPRRPRSFSEESQATQELYGLQRSQAAASAVAGERSVRPAVSDRPAAHRAGRPLRADLSRRRA